MGERDLEQVKLDDDAAARTQAPPAPAKSFRYFDDEYFDPPNLKRWHSMNRLGSDAGNDKLANERPEEV